jgi:hypothetical protein
VEGIDYTLSLNDHMSAAALKASNSLSDLASQMEKEVKAAERAEKAEKAHEQSLGKMIEKATGGIIKVDVLKQSYEGLGAGMTSMMAGLKSGEMKEVVSGLTESLSGMAKMLDLVVPGLGQTAAALIRFGGAGASALVGMVQEGALLSIEATQAKQAMIGMFAALGGGNEIGIQTEEMLSKLSGQIGVTKDTLAPLTKSFMAMGFEGEESLKKVTTAAISAQAIMGDPAAAQAFETLTKKIQVAAETGHGLKIPAKGLASLASMGIRVDDVAKRMGVSAKTMADQLKAGTVNAVKFGDALQDALIEKGAGPLDRMGKSLGNMKKMFTQSIEDMFEDMGKSIDPFLDKVKDLFGLFDQAKPSGAAMKSALGDAFGFIFGAATDSIEPIEIMFLRLELASLQAYGLIKSHWLSIKAVLITVQPVITEIARQFALIGKVLAMAQSANVAIFGTAGVQGHKGKGADSAGAFGAGADTGAGLADGMKSTVGEVADAGKMLGEAATAGVKGPPLEVHSPSRAMFAVGGHAGHGLALGMHASVGRVDQAATRLGASAVGGTGAGMRASDYTPRRGNAGRGNITIQITAPEGVTNAQELTEIAVAALFERYQLHEGA